MVAFKCKEFLSEKWFEAVLATFCSYDYGVNASEEVKKIATDQKDYHKCSVCVIICCIAKARKKSNNLAKMTFFHSARNLQVSPC